MKMAERDDHDSRKFVILGGGPAGLSCAETLR
jgi:flavin-dependent dehydrogenase